MTTFIDASGLSQGNVGNPKDGNRYLRDIMPIGADSTNYQFPSGAPTLLTFGVPKCIFIDNQENSVELAIMVGTTGQTFVAPSTSAGFYYLDAVIGSNIEIVPSGAVTAPVTVVIYNFDRSPVVWYKSSVVQAAVTVPNGGDVAVGSTTDLADVNPASTGTLISFTKGVLQTLLSAVTDLVNILAQVTITATQTSPYSYANYTTNGAKVVSAGPAVFEGVTVNTAGGAGSIVITDGGTTVATIDSAVAGTYSFGGSNGVQMGTNLHAAITGAPDVTILYR